MRKWRRREKFRKKMKGDGIEWNGREGNGRERGTRRRTNAYMIGAFLLHSLLCVTLFRVCKMRRLRLPHRHFTHHMTSTIHLHSVADRCMSHLDVRVGDTCTCSDLQIK